MVVCGDLVDASPDKPQWQESQVKSFKDVMSTVDESIPLVCLCGNHGEPVLSGGGVGGVCGGIANVRINMSSTFYFLLRTTPDLLQCDN